MTREEAIYRLKNMAWLYGSAEREQNIEAINMAIKALSSNMVDVVRCKDCISFYEELCTETGSPVEPNDYCSYGKQGE